MNTSAWPAEIPGFGKLTIRADEVRCLDCAAPTVSSYGPILVCLDCARWLAGLDKDPSLAASAALEERRKANMSILLKAPRYENAPEGLHVATCCDTIDLGIVKTNFGDKHMVKAVWQIEATDKNGKRFTVSKRWNASLDRRATLRKDLESWRGRKFTAAEEESFDFENVMGAPCQIQIVHNPADGGKVYANVEAILPLAKGQERLQVTDYVRVKDRVQQDATPPEDQVADVESVPF